MVCVIAGNNGSNLKEPNLNLQSFLVDLEYLNHQVSLKISPVLQM